MRAFVAVVPPERVIEDLDEFLSVRRDAAPFRWSDPEQMHITLAFAAEVRERSYDEWVERLERAAGRRRPFEASVSGGGAFPQVAEAKVLWAGLDLDESAATELTRLATGVRAATTKSGIEVSGQRFTPHLTLARLGHPEEVSNWVRLLDAYRGPAWTIDRIRLIASHLGEGRRRRPRYEPLAEFSLGR